MNKKNIPLMKVFMSPREELMPELEEILYSGMITEGVKVKEFEEAFQEKFKLKYRPLSVNSGTSALQLAYRLCKHPERGIIITSPLSCFANVCALVNEGFKIVWCDIDPRTGNVDARDVQRKIELYGFKNIAAVSYVDLGGFPNNIDSLYAASEGYIPLVQDAAQSLGSKWDGYYTGSHPGVRYTAFSLQAIKHLTAAGDGGMLSISGQSKRLIDINVNMARKLKWFGISRESVKEETRWHYDIQEPGYKFHMNNVNATVGLANLKHMDFVINKHKENGKWFDNNLKGVDGLKTPYVPKKSEPSYWIYPVRVQDKRGFAKMMKSKGVGTNIAHVRNDSYSCMKNADYVLNHTERLPGLDEYEEEYIFIPCGWWVSKEDREYMLDCIKGGW